MLLWGVETHELYSLHLTDRFPSYDRWTKVGCQQSSLLLTNAMDVIESSRHVPQLPPRLHLPGPRRAVTLGAPDTPATLSMADYRLSMPNQPAPPPLPAPTAKTLRATFGNGRRHRKKEFQMLPTRARCEVSCQLLEYKHFLRTSNTLYFVQFDVRLEKHLTNLQTAVIPNNSVPIYLCVCLCICVHVCMFVRRFLPLQTAAAAR